MADQRSSAVKAKTLEYKQAMKDFHTMFPSLERSTIECVLRSNAGHVDSTIDQLLQLSQNLMQTNTHEPNHYMFERFCLTGNDNSLNDDLPSEFRVPPPSGDEEQPPRYTPNQDYTFSPHPVQPTGRFRDWNPPLLGALPDDFLRMRPFSSHVAKEDAHASRKPHVKSQHGSASEASPSRRDKSKLQRRKTTTGSDNVLVRSTQNPHHSPLTRMVRESDDTHRQVHRRASVPAPRQRNIDEQAQYIEDRKVALMLQNEEFLRELRRNEQFLQELSKGDAATSDNHKDVLHSRENFQAISVDPLQELPRESPKSNEHKSTGAEDSKAFKESLKHMNKSSKKSFIELARKFNARRKSYKSMNDTLDPVFANHQEE